MTNEQCNAALSNGLSIEGLTAFMARKHNKPAKLSKQAWLDNKKDCAHCKRDGNCKRQLYGYQACCVWSMEMMIMLDEAYYQAKDKGEVE